MRATFWEPPRLRAGAEHPETEQRRATWLELVYDLVYVVAVAALAHRIEADTTERGLLGFVALYVPIWWAWVGQTLYANRFDTDDASQRLLVGLQIVIVAALAATVGHALEDRSAHFALAYATVRGVLVAQYVRAGRHVPIARGLTTRYAIGFGLGVGLWLLSAAIPPPGRYAVWAVAMVVEYGTPLVSRRFLAQLPPQPQHLPERLGLFTIIVLGESVTSIVAGLEARALAPMAIVVAALGVVVVLSLWWVYFDNIDESVVLRTYIAGQIWFYGHLPLMVAITALGVGIERLITADPGAAVPPLERWLVCGALVATLLTLALLHLAESDHKEPTRLIGAAAVAALAIFGGGLSPAWLAAGLAAVMTSLVLFDMRQHRSASANRAGAGAAGHHD